MYELNGYRLRLINEDDLPMVLNWRNAESIRANMYTDHFISLEEHLSWFACLKNKNDQIHLICEFEGIPFGVVNFVQISQAFQRAYWGFYLGGEQPSGRGAAMEYVAIEYAFSRLKLRKLCCEVISFNKSVLKLHERFGFVQEGLFNAHIIKNGKFEDVVSLALFDSVWEAEKLKLQRICFRNRR